MRYRIVAVGAPSRNLAKAISAYAERIGRFGGCDLVDVKPVKAQDPNVVRRKEGEALLAKVDGYLVVLDERGDAFSTAQLAGHVSSLEQRGVSRVTLAIGGAEGLDGSVRDAAQERWRLSDFTLAHDVARLVLLEQVYRMETLRAGHPYHRGG